MRRLTISIFIISGLVSCQTKTEIVRLNKNQLPKEITIQGNIISAQKWTDKLGVNYFILSGTDEFVPQKAIEAQKDYIINDGDTIYSGVKDYRDKEIYMVHFVVSGNEPRAVLKEEASVRDCPVDLELGFLEVPPRITDLDKDGTFEIWTTYHKGCHGDVSPTEMVLLMNTDAKKYSLTGLRIADIGDNRKVGGQIYSNEFLKLPDSFKNYADSVWNKFKRWN